MEIVKLTRTKSGNTIDTSAYEAYLKSVANQLPPAVLAYAGAPWHYDFRHAQCPHDATLMNLELVGGSRPEKQPPFVDDLLVLKLLGNQRDQVLTLTYVGVTSWHSVYVAGDRQWLGDLLIDEVRLQGDGLVVHEFVFDGGTVVIVAKGFEHRWEPWAPT